MSPAGPVGPLRRRSSPAMNDGHSASTDTPLQRIRARLTSAPGRAPVAPHHRRRRLAALAVLAVLALGLGAAIGAGSSGGGGHRVARAAAIGGYLSRIQTLAGGGAGSFVVAEQQAENAAISRTLAYAPAVRMAGTQHREIALTFDDGPGPYTPQIVAILKRHKVPATFFVVGRSVKDFGVYLPSELAAGFVLGDHTQDHEPMAALSLKDQTAQLVDQAADIEHYGAPFPHLFRPPYGSFNETTLSITKRLKMLTILWTIDTNDFAQPGVKKIVNAVLDGARPGAIVLMHDAGGTRTQTVQALPTIIRALRKRGYTLVTVPRLLADDPPLEADQVPPKGLSGG